MDEKTDAMQWLPRLNGERCTGCGLCVAICPTAALALRAGKAVLIAPERCLYCALCEDVCPTHAIDLPYFIYRVLSSEESLNTQGEGHMTEQVQPTTTEQPPTFVAGIFVLTFIAVVVVVALSASGQPRAAATVATSVPVYVEQPAEQPAAVAESAAVEPQAPAVRPAAVNAVSIVRNPSDLPPPIGNREPMTLKLSMETLEVVGQLADGTTFRYFTFDGKVPGPMLRIRVGDTVELTLKNASTSIFPHSIDLHAVTGPGGGAVYTQTPSGGETKFTFKALNVGLYVYHCATASIPHHIQSGMYGLILVEPPGGLPPVDREFYVMQGDMYTQEVYGTQGDLTYSADKMHHEQAEYVVFNGAVGALTSEANALQAKVGETVRIYFGVGGPNYTSSFHVIGEIFDRVYEQASLTGAALTDVQTTTVPPGGATMVEFKLDVPGRYILVDHALGRLELGGAGFLVVEGEDDPEIYAGENPNMAGH
jgi:nitrite reductase (NO-forming)